MPQPLATIASQTASLTVVLFDAMCATDWVPTKAAATKAQFTGHPAEIMRLLGKGEDVAEFDVGASHAFAFELEGKSGRLEVYRLADGGLALIAPPRAWWREHAEHGRHLDAIDALFEAALDVATAGEGDDGDELGVLDLASSKLALVYMWHKQVGAARELAKQLAPGAAVAFGDGYGATENGAIVDLGEGAYRLRKRELEAPWDGDQSLAVVYLTRRA